MKLELAINRCPKHGYWAVSLDNPHGGLRLTPGKCCGGWDRVKAWEIDPESLIADIRREAKSDD